MATPTDLQAEFFYVLQEPARIIFVDDDPIMREFATVHLASESAGVVTAANGFELIAKLEVEAADIVLLDLGMPGMDGFQALETLRSDRRWSGLPVIVVTAREDVAAIDRAFRLGSTGFVVKPINWRLLSYQIRYVLRSSRGEQALAQELARRTSEAEEAIEQLRDLARQSSRFMADALGADRRLGGAAAGLVEAVEQALAPAKAA
jgi:DNA-binding response OmpR family regulator